MQFIILVCFVQVFIQKNISKFVELWKTHEGPYLERHLPSQLLEISE